VTLVLRTAGEPAAQTKAVRAELTALDPQLAVYDVRTMDDLMNNSVFALLPLRMGMTAAATQGVITLLLSIMGLYAVVAFSVAQRTREIGIRMALGADAARVVSLLVREGLRLTLTGIVVGLIVAALLGFGLSKVLFGLAPVEPVVFGGVIALLLGTTALACWAPARRAARVDPSITLRSE
jgi:ABC-type antimicrobial peptide transport system permease subunit